MNKNDKIYVATFSSPEYHNTKYFHAISDAQLWLLKKVNELTIEVDYKKIFNHIISKNEFEILSSNLNLNIVEGWIETIILE